MLEKGTAIFRIEDDVINEIYLDNNATTMLAPQVLEAMCNAAKEGFGNPSSEHRAGERSRRAIALARNSVAELLRAPTESIVFGSGVTELNNWVISNALAESNANHYVISEVEHSSILSRAIEAEAQGTRVTRIPVDHEGLIDLQALEIALQSPTSLVSIQWVNNETGVIQPIRDISRLCTSASVPFHCDAAQAAGKIETDLASLQIDFVTISAHKMHGPSGVGAIAIRERHLMRPFLFGGSQEFALRPGTENIIGIVGFGAAAATRKSMLSRAINHMATLRDSFEDKVRSAVTEIRINGSLSNRVCNTTNLLFPGLDGAAIVALMDRQGVLCSQTSACLSNRPEPSHVLTAMGRSEEEAYSSLRFSFSEQNTMDEVDLAIFKLLSILEKLTGSQMGANCIGVERKIEHEV